MDKWDGMGGRGLEGRATAGKRGADSGGRGCSRAAPCRTFPHAFPPACSLARALTVEDHGHDDATRREGAGGHSGADPVAAAKGRLRLAIGQGLGLGHDSSVQHVVLQVRVRGGGRSWGGSGNVVCLLGRRGRGTPVVMDTCRPAERHAPARPSQLAGGIAGGAVAAAGGRFGRGGGRVMSTYVCGATGPMGGLDYALQAPGMVRMQQRGVIVPRVVVGSRTGPDGDQREQAGYEPRLGSPPAKGRHRRRGMRRGGSTASMGDIAGERHCGRPEPAWTREWSM